MARVVKVVTREWQPNVVKVLSCILPFAIRNLLYGRKKHILDTFLAKIFTLQYVSMPQFTLKLCLDNFTSLHYVVKIVESFMKIYLVPVIHIQQTSYRLVVRLSNFIAGPLPTTLTVVVWL